MILKKTLKTLRKIPGNLALILLTGGASLILGFLSFGGMFALWPILPLAFLSFALSVAYEGEIYLQNIKGSIKKLFSNDYLENRLAKEYLTHFHEEACAPDSPQFFKDYLAQIKLLEAFSHKKLSKEDKKKKKHIERTLEDMKHWFAQQLFPSKEKPATENSTYAKQLQDWLRDHEQSKWQERLKNRGNQFIGAKIFSGLAGLFMGLGSTYLIVEAFSVIPVFATIPFAVWPVMIVPMALIAGTAYGMLTFNALTDLINNKTLVKWYNKLRKDLSEGVTWKNILMATTGVFLVTLAIALTICTAGTWWTVASKARPLFDWMKKIPTFVMGVINPIITGLSSLFFNLENTAESLTMVDDALKSKKNIFRRMYDAVVRGYEHLRKTENWLQIFNPFRLILKLTITPLRFILFLGHLISIAVTADRMPGIPQILAAIVAMISEGFEDAHYFVGHNHDHSEEHQDGHEHHHEHGHDHEHHCHEEHKTPDPVAANVTLLKTHLEEEHGHNHDLDLPTKILKLIATPLYALAALWDSGASTLNKPSEERRQLDLRKAWNKQYGIGEVEEVKIPETAEKPSQEWKVEQVIAKIDRHQKNHLAKVWSGQELAEEKNKELQQLKSTIRTPGTNLADTLVQAKEQPVYNMHRLFAQEGETTSTKDLLEELPRYAVECN